MTALALPICGLVALLLGAAVYRKGARELVTARDELRAALGRRGLGLTGDLDRPSSRRGSS